MPLRRHAFPVCSAVIAAKAGIHGPFVGPNGDSRRHGSGVETLRMSIRHLPT